MTIPRGERIRRMLLHRADVRRMQPVGQPTPPRYYVSPRPERLGKRKHYGAKKAKARKHRKVVARQHQKERKKWSGPVSAPS